MSKEKRFNQNYEIIESCTAGSTEIVIGHNPKAPSPYVCWYCRGGDNYYWGTYCNTMEAARENLRERFQRKCLDVSCGQTERKQRNHDDRER